VRDRCAAASRKPRFVPGSIHLWENLAACLRIREDARQAGLVAPSLATYYAGVPAYFCPEFRAIDLLGKSDRHLAATALTRVLPATTSGTTTFHRRGARRLRAQPADPGGSLLRCCAAGHTGRAPRWEALLESSEFRARCEGHVIDDRVSLGLPVCSLATARVIPIPALRQRDVGLAGDVVAV
jgi:hypothetical protein